MSMKLPTLDKVRNMLTSARRSNPTTVRDRVGNMVREHAKLFWVPLGAVVTVTEIKAGGLLRPGAPPTPGELTIAIKFPFDSAQPETFLKDFVLIVDPEMTSTQAAGCDANNRGDIECRDS